MRHPDQRYGLMDQTRISRATSAKKEPFTVV